MYISILSGAFQALECFMVQVEVDISNGLPCMEMIGCLASEVKETRERVRVGIKNSGYEIPSKRITVSMSPSDMRKDGCGFDLPVAVGILMLTDGNWEENNKNTNVIILGEIGLDGKVKPVRGILPILLKAREEGVFKCIIPAENESEARYVKGMEIYPVRTVRQGYLLYRKMLGQEEITDDFIKALEGEKDKKDEEGMENKGANVIDFGGENRVKNAIHVSSKMPKKEEERLDFDQIRGQAAAKRAAQIAAAGFHNLLLFGSPGSGKSMIAKRIPTILPQMTYEESLEVTKIHSIAGALDPHSPWIGKRPFIAPHHSVTAAALVGGGQYPKPGLITLANKGVLFFGGYFCKTAETPNLRALWRFSQLEFFKKSAKNKLHSTFLLLALPLFGFSFAKRFMGIYTLMAKLYTIWQKEITKWRNYTRMAKGERAYGI